MFHFIKKFKKKPKEIVTRDNIIVHIKNLGEEKNAEALHDILSFKGEIYDIIYSMTPSFYKTDFGQNLLNTDKQQVKVFETEAWELAINEILIQLRNFKNDQTVETIGSFLNQTRHPFLYSKIKRERFQDIAIGTMKEIGNKRAHEWLTELIKGTLSFNVLQKAYACLNEILVKSDDVDFEVGFHFNVYAPEEQKKILENTRAENNLKIDFQLNKNFDYQKECEKVIKMILKTKQNNPHYKKQIAELFLKIEPELDCSPMEAWLKGIEASKAYKEAGFAITKYTDDNVENTITSDKEYSRFLLYMSLVKKMIKLDLDCVHRIIHYMFFSCRTTKEFKILQISVTRQYPLAKSRSMTMKNKENMIDILNDKIMIDNKPLNENEKDKLVEFYVSILGDPETYNCHEIAFAISALAYMGTPRCYEYLQQFNRIITDNIAESWVFPLLHERLESFSHKNISNTLLEE